jgi:hypothetical protein
MAKEGFMDSFGYLIVIGFAVVAIIAVLLLKTRDQDAAERIRRAAYAAYQVALVNLTADPSNPYQKQRARELGRIYAVLTREQKAVTIFDELSLFNEISIATVGASVVTTAPASVEDRLESLAALQRKGLVSADEYADRRKQLLAEI